MEWNKEKTLILIKEFHQRPGLWNMTHEDYRKKETKRRLLEEIAAKFNNYISAPDIERKFHTLRTQYHREIHRMNVIRGTEAYKSKWFAFQHLQFLNDPSACRNSQSTRRRSSATPAKIVYLSNLNVEQPSNLKVEPVATTTATIHSVQVTVADKNTHTPENNTMDLRKDLRVLFEEAVDSEEDKHEELHVSNSAVSGRDEYVHEEIQCKASTNTSFEEEEHLVDEQPPQQNQPDTEVDMVEEHEPYHRQINQSPPAKMMKIDPNNTNVSTTRRAHELYQDVNYVASTQHLYGTKNVYKDAETHTAQPLVMTRDEFSTFGECVANELRFITDRQILISVKHKINTALFEASLAQLQKNSNG